MHALYMGGICTGGRKYILPVIRPPRDFACLVCRLGGRIGGTLRYMLPTGMYEPALWVTSNKLAGLYMPVHYVHVIS